MTRMLSEWFGLLALIVGLGLLGYQVYSIFARHNVDRMSWEGVVNLRIAGGVFTLHSDPNNLPLLAHIDRYPKDFEPRVTTNRGWRSRWIGLRWVSFAGGETIWAFNFPAALPGLLAILLTVVCYRTARRLPKREYQEAETKDPWSDDSA